MLIARRSTQNFFAMSARIASAGHVAKSRPGFGLRVVSYGEFITRPPKARPALLSQKGFKHSARKRPLGFKNSNIAVLIAEQNAGLTGSVADRIYVLRPHVFAITMCQTCCLRGRLWSKAF
jgi:hypothetical protein